MLHRTHCLGALWGWLLPLLTLFNFSYLDSLLGFFFSSPSYLPTFFLPSKLSCPFALFFPPRPSTRLRPDLPSGGRRLSLR